MRFQSFRAWIVSSAFVLTAAVAFAQMPATQPSGDDEQLRAAHQQLLQAAQQHDKEAVSRLVADDLTWVTPAGKVTGKSEMLESIGTAPREVTIDQTRTFGKTALVTGVARFEDGREARFLQEWVNQDGQWKVMAHEGTLIGSSSPTATGTSGETASSGMAGRMERSMKTSRNAAPKLDSDDQRAIWKTQQDLRDAFLKGDSAAYGKLTTDDYIRITVDGKLQGKSEFLQTVGQNAGKSKGHLEMNDVQITVNGDTARLVGEIGGTLPGGEPQPPERITRIFVKQNGRWQQAGMAFAPIREQ
jgi:ketosteroid isomerase-like protein